MAPRTDSFTAAARSLALPIAADSDSDDDLFPAQSPRSPEQSQTLHRQSHSASPETSTSTPRARSTREKWRQRGQKWARLWYSFTPLQRAGILLLDVVLIVLTVLFLVYNRRIFAWLSPVAKSWRELPGGWLILFAATLIVSFPPLIGYSTCITITGFVYGMRGWFLAASATVLGSTISFLCSRTLLRNFVSKLTEKNQRFAALSLVLKHDGLKLLVMIRLCPLPYSLSNGAISTIPTVSTLNFALATAAATPKLLLGVFVGSRLGDLAENGDKMDTKTKIVSYFGIVFGVAAGFATGYWVYVRTKARARQLEAEEVEAGGVVVARGGQGAGRRSGRASVVVGAEEFLDDSDEGEAVDVLGDGGAGAATGRHAPLRSPAAFEVEDLEGGGAGDYRDEFSDDEAGDAQGRDVFEVGDGDGAGGERRGAR